MCCIAKRIAIHAYDYSLSVFFAAVSTDDPCLMD